MIQSTPPTLIAESKLAVSTYDIDVAHHVTNIVYVR